LLWGILAIPTAVKLYGKKKGVEIFAWTHSNPHDFDSSFVELNVKIPQSIVYYSIAPLVDGEIVDGAWFHDRDIPRDDPALVEVVQELKGKANGRCANLRIVKIPADVKWEIAEYDGYEHVAEVHRRWR